MQVHITLASDFSGLAYSNAFFYGLAAALYGLVNAGLFLFYYHRARPRELGRRLSRSVIVAALLFTLIAPLGFVAGGALGTIDGSGGFSIRGAKGIPVFVGSLVLARALIRDVRAVGVWLAPLLGALFVMIWPRFAPDLRDGRIFLMPIPWHITCIVALWTFGRRAWKKELADAAVRCSSCGYSLKGLTGPACPECGQALAK